ncbi:hypothetical protein K2X05_11050 [bacterium]|nr:hypothetical protein [bacterium]
MQELSIHLQKKMQLAQNQQLKTDLFTYKVYLSIHAVNLCFHVTSEEVIRDLYDHYPLSWFQTVDPKSAVHIFWQNSTDLGWSDEEWENEPTYDCVVVKDKDRRFAVQRDFVATMEGNNCLLVCPYYLADGFYNFLRWLLPQIFLQKEILLLHSSCVLDEKKNAYFCLGPSGAGKSTIASFRPRKRILGDDMNVIKIKDGQCWAQAGALGQSILNPKEYSNWYPVKALFWLKQALDLKMTSMSKAAQLRCLHSSVANVFWDQLTQEQVNLIFRLAWQILQHNSMYELSFPKTEGLWPTIFEKTHEL